VTWRARAYLAVIVVRHAGVGAFCVLAPRTFRASSFDTLKSLAPLQVWGAVLLVTGTMAALAVILNWEPWARVVLVASATVSGCWAAAFLMAGIRGQLAGPTAPILWAALVFKDLIVSGMPLRAPLEQAARESLPVT